MRRLVVPALVLLLLTACGSPFAGGFGDGAPPPTPMSVPIAGALATPLATATRGTPEATATRSTPDARATVTRPVASSTAVVRTPSGMPTVSGTASPIATATRAVGTPGTPIPVRPGPPATPGLAGTPGLASTPGVAGTPRPGTPTAPPAAAQGTLLQLFAPYRPGGLVSGLRVEGQVNGYCSGGSETLLGRPDAWRCMANNRIYDPCFAADSTDTAPLACTDDPWSGAVTLLTLTAPLPRDRANTAAGTTRNPWALQLANGARCQLIIGASATVAGMRIGAACSDGTQIVGDPDRSAGRWRVYILRDSDPSLTTEEVVVAWY
jgi:hypothetical protein